MANNNPKTSHLKPVYKNWVNTPTKAVRVPEIFLEEIEQFARMRDRSESGFEVIISLLDSLASEEIQQLKIAVDCLAENSHETITTTATEEAKTQLSDSEKQAFITKFGFVPSHYQLKIIDWILRGNGNGCCNAVAGAGKSTTLVLVGKTLEEAGYKPSEIKICVFGKANSLDLIAKFGSRWKSSISTLNSAGWGLIKKYLKIYSNEQVKLSNNKYKWIAQDLNLIIGRKNRRSILKDREIIADTSDFLKLIDLVRLCDVEVTALNISKLASHFEIEKVYKPQDVAYWIKECLEIGEQQAINKQCFDFVEQIYLPILWDLGSDRSFKPYKFVLVDECQDLNEAQKKLVQLLAGKNGRIIAVGDPHQAVMGFAGADDNSYYNIVKSINAVELPLSICYRCPISHIDLVKKEFPNIPIQPSQNAAEGIIKKIKSEEIFNYIQDKDMIIGRKTSPLVGLCIQLIGRGKKAIVKGKKIGEQLNKEVDELTKLPSYYWQVFSDCLEQYRSIKINQYQGLDRQEELIEVINDKLNAIATVYQSNPQCQNVDDLKFEIDKLFSDNDAPITLSTIHRAKGLEANRVFVWCPDHLPLTWRDQQDWQYQQERNLLYVALTRSKSEMYICGKCEWCNLPFEEVNNDESTVKEIIKDDFFRIIYKAEKQLNEDLKCWFPVEEVRSRFLNQISDNPYALEEWEAEGKMRYKSQQSKNAVQGAVNQFKAEFERALKLAEEKELNQTPDRPHPLDPDYF